MSELDDLLDTRAGLSLANGCWQEGAAAMYRAVREAEGTGTMVTPRSPYSAPLLAMVKDTQSTGREPNGV